MLPWSPDFELDYVRSTTQAELLDRSKKFMDIFGINIPNTKCVVMEVGCGAAGGFLAHVDPIHYRVAVDPLMGAYRRVGWLPDGLDEMRAEFAHSLGVGDNFADYLFAIEVLDHCADDAEFQKSLEELARVLAPNGMLYFMLPARPIGEHDGHPCARAHQRQVEDALRKLGLTTVCNSFPKHGTWLQMTKP